MESKRIALLIDCDNVSHAAIGGVLDELAKYGMVNIRHAHGNWSSPHLAGWVEKVHPYAIRPMQQFAFTKGKNATDSAMIIDAMDLLYSKNVDAFALMTSDSDFTPLVLRLLESGLPVYGFGEKKTPKPFVDACSQFIYTENLMSDDQEKAAEGDPPLSTKRTRNELRSDTSLVRLLRTAAEKTADDAGWSHLSQVGQFIRNNSSFSAVNYGHRTLGDLIRMSELFEIDMRHGGTAMFIKNTRKSSLTTPHQAETSTS
ncbi:MULTISPECIES: NYN domain-containing protein [Pseudomonas]|uniref:NYN domain-containing protein n=1 Tax=Pseudomonas TaxID=286 RepID=UPI001A9163B1|nr:MULTISPECIES: NYN domain-containing protein [Pseudomonas]MDZ5432254.1 NYN domain-containing protein [Pseudomonas fluorescens]